MTPEPGYLIAAKYRLKEALAAGGMGSIWVADHVDLDVEVAVKLMSTELAQSSLGRKRFKREARAAARLKSPHVTQIHDYGVFEEQPYIVMELLEGEDLDSYIQRKGTLSLARCAEIIRPVCTGLKLAHDAGIVHRDIKPSNIYLSRSGDDEVVKILDFGIAKQTIADTQIDGATESGVLVGSPRYMSPEQAMGLEVDARSDIWSLGVVLYEMLTGQVPFEGDNLGQLVTAICTKEHPLVTTLVDLPPAVDLLFAELLRRKPDERLRLPMVFAAAVDALAADEPLDFDAPTLPLLRSEPPPRSAKPREDETVASDDDVAVSAPSVSEVAIAKTEAALEPTKDLTSPGLGLDSSETEAPHRKNLLWLAAVAAVGGVVVYGLWHENQERVTSTRAPPAASTVEPATTSSALETSPATSASTVPSARASVSASASVSAAPREVPPIVAPRPKPPPAPTYDSVFGVPDKGAAQKRKPSP